MINTISEILKSSGLRITDTRQEVLQQFLTVNSAVSQGDIEQNLGEGTDRVTVYRTLKTFLEKGIIHKILDDAGGVKYAICKEQCQHGQHQHNHLHFKCSVCEETQCLENHFIPDFILPQGFKTEEVNVLLQGVCPKCN